MIPRRIHLRNFLSYRECTVDLAGLHLAVLCGKNGDGKSALLDGMTWALWGAARGRLEDDLIYLTEGEMLAEFEFDVDGDRYAAIRKRSRGKTGSLELLQIGDDGRRVSVTGGTIRETQAEILRRVRMDYDTFINSAFIAQGRANEFTRKNAAERKEVFRKVLGLERYEELATAANDRRKEAAASLLAIGREAEEIRAEVETLPAVEEELQATSGSRAALEPKIAAADEEVTTLRQAAADYERMTRDVATGEQRATGARAACTAAEASIASTERQLCEARAVVQEGDAITKRYRELVAAREAEHVQAERQQAAQQEERTIEAAERAIGEERARMESALANLRRERDVAETAAAALPQLRKAETDLHAAHDELATLDGEVESARVSEGQLRAASASARAESEQCKRQAQEMKAKEAQLEGVAACPVCRQPLAPDDLDHVRGEYAEQRRALGHQFRAAVDAADEALAGADASKSRLDALLEQRKKLDAVLRARERELLKELPAATRAADDLPRIVAEIAAAETKVDSQDFAATARQQLAEARARMAVIAYDPAGHQGLRNRVRELAGAEDAYRELARAAERATALETALVREQEALEEKSGVLREAEETLTSAREALASAADVTPRLKAAEATIAGLRAEEQELMLQQGRLEQRRDHLVELQARLETQADRLRALKDEEGVFSELAVAFGKNGVQAMLIDQSLPQLETIANEMLDRMTGGRIQVSLHTQRQNLKGNMVETLDIRISDDLGGRDYDMYSGGEAFRVDFALRIALAKLLAMRAGAALPTLIIDEGFGTQDQEGIDRLVEAINAIAEQFRLILVVTHIEELKGRFDRRIEVTKDQARGSVATVV